VTSRSDRVLAERFAALAAAAPEPDADWADVVRRARGHGARAPGGRRGLLRGRAAALAAGVAGLALLLAVPALGLGTRVTDLVDDIFEAEQDLRRSHPRGDALPRNVFVYETGPERISGRAPSPAVAAVEIQFADGGSASVQPRAKGIFSYEVPDGRVPELVVARARNGALIESVPLPPPPGAPSQPGPLGNPDPAGDCPLGKPPTSPSPALRGGPVRPLTDKLVLACTTTPNGQRIELVGYRIGLPGEHSQLCIELVRVPEGHASGCGSARGADGIAVHSFSFGAGLPRRLTGAATRRARAIRFHYRHRGQVAWQHTTAISLHSPTLARLGVRQPFAYWIADLPSGAQPLRVEARAGGGVLASAPGRPGR
jgi:hypothetical protein